MTVAVVATKLAVDDYTRKGCASSVRRFGQLSQLPCRTLFGLPLLASQTYSLNNETLTYGSLRMPNRPQ